MPTSSSRTQPVSQVAGIRRYSTRRFSTGVVAEKEDSMVTTGEVKVAASTGIKRKRKGFSQDDSDSEYAPESTDLTVTASVHGTDSQNGTLRKSKRQMTSTSAKV